MQLQGRAPPWTPGAEKWAMQQVEQRSAFALAYAGHLQRQAGLLTAFGALVELAGLAAAPPVPCAARLIERIATMSGRRRFDWGDPRGD
jgi:hypothetical protein